MAIKEKTLVKRMLVRMDDGNSAADNKIISELIPTDGMLGKIVMVMAEVVVQVKGQATTSTVYPTVQYSLDGESFVDSPTAVSRSFTAGNNVAAGKMLIFSVDMKSIIAPFVRFLWKGSHASSDTNLTAGKIKHSLAFMAN